MKRLDKCLVLTALLMALATGYPYVAHAQHSPGETPPLENQSDLKGALEATRTMYQEGQKTYPVLINYARLSAWNQDFEKAKSLYQEALAAAQTSEEKMAAELGLGEVYSWQGRYAEAKALYRPWVQAAPNSPEPRFRLAQANAWGREVKAAEKLYRENLAAFPNHTPSRLGLAEVLVWRGKYREAFSIYRQLKETHPENPDVWVGLVRAQTMHRDYLAAKQTVNEALTRFPKHRELTKALLFNKAYLRNRDSGPWFRQAAPLDEETRSYFTTSLASGPDRMQYTERELETGELKRPRPMIQSVYTGHTEAGTVDEKLKYNKLDTMLTLYPTADTQLLLTFRPTYYESGGNLEHEDRYSYGVGALKQWSDKVRTGGWVGLSTYTNQGPLPILARAAVEFRPSDYWQPALFFNRDVIEESVLSAAGLRPTVGVFANGLVGRVIRNEWIFQNSFRLPWEIRGQFNPSVGVDTASQLSDNPFWRLRYFLERDIYQAVRPWWSITWYGRYEGDYWHFKDDRLGHGVAFLINKAFGLPLGSDTVSPIPTNTTPGTGGYFSPDRYWRQAFRLGKRGDLFNKRFFFDVSGFAGFQDISRFGTDFTTGVDTSGEFSIGKTLSVLLGLSYQRANPFNQTTFYVGLRKRL